MAELDSIKRATEMYQNSIKTVKQSVDRLLQKNAQKAKQEAKQEAFIAELKAYADESTALMADSRYSMQVKWITELRLAYSRALERTDPSKIVDIAKIQGKIENLDTLLSRPKQAVKEYEKMSKENQ